MKILLVDDDTLDRMSIKRLLKSTSRPMEITETGSVDEVKELLQINEYELILLDYILPRVNSLDFIKTIISLSPKHTSLIVLSHLDDNEIATKCIKAGAKGFFNKNNIDIFLLLKDVTKK